MKNKFLAVDRDIVYKMAVLALEDYRCYLKDELKDHNNGGWLHPDDVVGNKRRIDIIDEILKDFK